MSKFRILIVWGVLLILTSLSVAVEIDPLKADPAAMKQWHGMRFGIFIHWGPVSLTGHKIGWSRCRETPIEECNQLCQKFNPTEFNSEEWGKIAKDAGNTESARNLPSGLNNSMLVGEVL